MGVTQKICLIRYGDPIISHVDPLTISRLTRTKNVSVWRRRRRRKRTEKKRRQIRSRVYRLPALTRHPAEKRSTEASRATVTLPRRNPVRPSLLNGLEAQIC